MLSGEIYTGHGWNESNALIVICTSLQIVCQQMQNKKNPIELIFSFPSRDSDALAVEKTYWKY